MGDIELDDFQIVEVTGKAYRDKQRKQKKGGCECNPSLRATTIIIFVCIGIVYVVGVAIGNILMFNSLEYLDKGSSNTSINRLSMLIEDDMIKLKQLVAAFGATPFAYGAVEQLKATPVAERAALESITCNEGDFCLNQFVIQFLNNTVNMDGTNSFATSTEINYWALFDTDFNTLWSVYHPQKEGSDDLAGVERQYPCPLFHSSTISGFIEESGKPANSPDGWTLLMVPDEYSSEGFLVSLNPVFFAGNSNGYFMGGRNIKPRMKGFANDVPSCITLQFNETDTDKWEDDDIAMFKEVVPGTFGPNKTYGGIPSYIKKANATLANSAGRVCPAVPLFNATSNLMAGYMKLCGRDPKKFEGDPKLERKASCITMRLDRPMSMVDQGTVPVVSLSVEIIGMMIVLCVIFVIFLDCVVLRRIVNLSNVIRKQTRGHAEALKDDDETGTSTHDEKAAAEKAKEKEKLGKSGKSSKGKSGKSASGTSENSRTTNSSDAGDHRPSARDEIGNLKRAMEQNALGLRKRLEAVNDSIKIEQQKTVRHKQAMQLLNLWCGRKDYFPGLRPNAMQLRYEPTRNLDDLLSNPLAIEYLKSHCESDRTLENLWFILDVSWLEELEVAEDNEQDPEKRAQIHEVATGAAKTILQRYIAVNAPQQINISAGTYKKLREKGEHYARHMFEEAVSEVKLMLNTDILPRFQKSAAYSAMSETLYIDSSGGGDESEFSDETVSTAGSILTDEAEEGEGGVAHVFARTFKNLHNAFEVGHDDNSSTYSASSSHATNSGALPAGTLTTTSGTAGRADEKATVNTSSKDGSSVTASSENSDDEPPKLKDEEKKKEEPKKEETKKESEESSDSSDSSSHSISSDSMSESSATTSTAASSSSSSSD